jgi:hypothetical protein
MGENRNAYRILVGMPEGKRPLGRPRRMWVDNIKMDLREIGWDGMDWIDMAQDRDQWRALVNKSHSVYYTMIQNSSKELWGGDQLKLKTFLLAIRNLHFFELFAGSRVLCSLNGAT